MMDQEHNHVLNINVVDLTHFCLISKMAPLLIITTSHSGMNYMHHLKT